MAVPGADKRHLMPLLEFLRFVCAKSQNDKNRFPKKVNGAQEALRDFPDLGSDTAFASASPEYPSENANSSSYDNSPSLSQDNSITFQTAHERRKRLRSPDNYSAALPDIPRIPVECEVVLKSPDKGFTTTKYFDFSLRDLGLELLVDTSAIDFTKEIAKQIQGLQCCYLLLGTSMIVTGDIIDMSLVGESVLVSPDRGLRVGIEWVPLRRVFRVPENIGAVREEAAQRIERIMEAERRGEKTPNLSPVELAKNPPAHLFPASPESDEED